MPFHMTSAAAREVLAAAQRGGADGLALRIAAKSTADGLAYGMGFDEAAPDDEVAAFDGLTVVIAPPSREALANTVLDFVQLDGGAMDFVFVESAADVPKKLESDPNSPRGCGGGGCSRCG